MTDHPGDSAHFDGAEGRGTAHVVAQDLGNVYHGVPLRESEQSAQARRLGWWYFAEYEMRKLRVYLLSVLFYDIGSLVLYLFTMGFALGALVDANTDAVDGVSYLMFVAPAIVVSGAVTTAVGEMSYPVLGSFKWDRVYIGAAASPVSPAQIALGHHFTVVLRNLIQATIGLGFLALFGALASPWFWVLVPIATLAGSAFGAPLQAFAASLKDEGFQFTAIQRFVVMPMFLFAGTFFPLTNMPGYLQWIGWLSPIWHGSELGRAATYGHALAPGMVFVHVGFLSALTVVGLALAVRVYRRRLAE